MFHINPITEPNAKLLFPSVLSTMTPLCIFYSFKRKIRPGTLHVVLVEQALCITYQVKKGHVEMMDKMRLDIVPAAGARSKQNEIVPRAIFYDLIFFQHHFR